MLTACAGFSGNVKTIRTAHYGPESDKSARRADQPYPERARLPIFGPTPLPRDLSSLSQIDSNVRALHEEEEEALHVDHVAIVGVVHGGLLCRCREKDQSRRAPSCFFGASSAKVFNSSCRQPGTGGWTRSLRSRHHLLSSALGKTSHLSYRQ